MPPWGVTQLIAGALSDRWGRTWLIARQGGCDCSCPLPTKSKMRYAGDANASYNYLLFPRFSVFMRVLIAASHCLLTGVLPCAIPNRRSAIGN
jgi:hypothetical protein